MEIIRKDSLAGLNLDPRCPKCGPASPLVDQKNDLGERRCHRCSSSLLAPEGSKLLITKILSLPEVGYDRLGQAHSSGGKAMPCPVCRGPMVEANMPRSPSTLACSKCKRTWFPTDQLNLVTNGRYGAVSQGRKESLSRPPEGALRKRSVGKMVAIAAVLLLLLAVGGGAAVYVLKPELLEPLLGGAIELDARPVVDKPKATPQADDGTHVDTLYGGRRVSWWRDRLLALKARDDADGKALYALTTARAAANGLELVESNGGLELKPKKAAP